MMLSVSLVLRPFQREVTREEGGTHVGGIGILPVELDEVVATAKETEVRQHERMASFINQDSK